ncbi:alpha-2-macroglobulin receptor-associated protein isoform X2 [Neodiprion pinetum]|uniref:alpha-2-macroglobulin receptor-associated protein isoform X2 n=1 Tax=Neodiprion fabricii TaxID=2872261 RepID=UPI001ED8F98C|nr:alpha-2-macroglobulin receptor-associated protein isoform X2 [Neodiprion fabricii]XP_046478065.1 alpha-2-macroglobulin receptor-associated protein isoform X2 [Neodiprion pinetum]
MSVKILNPILVLSLLLGCNLCEGLSKYSSAANAPAEDASIYVPTSVRELDKPFRMAKLNLLWSKAKHRLTEPKLQALFSDLKIHDKEEIALKHLKAESKDLEGLHEATMRKKLIGLMSTYDLLEHFTDTEDENILKRHKAMNDGSNYVSKDVFKNRKLNQLWAKAEFAGFTDEELAALKEEFLHHQEKVDEYMSLIADIDAGDTQTHKNSLSDKHENWNMLEQEEESNDVPGKNIDYLTKVNLMRDKHVKLKDGYDHLERLTAQGPNHKEFIEPKVQGLWRIAQEAKFNPDELMSLKEELRHYERRLLKLRHFHTSAALADGKRGKSEDFDNSTAEKNVKKHARIVEKLHLDLETKIMQKHVEL